MQHPFSNINFKILLGPLTALILFSLGFENSAIKMAAVVVWMAIWWMTEAVPLAVTSLLPLVCLPLLGIADSKLVASQYMDPIIFLFIGGFIIALAMERWNLHQRMALKILSMVGSKPSHILFGVMLSSYLVSMWISNTATVMMLISAVMAVIHQLDKNKNQFEISSSKFPAALLIGLAYSATIGGMATLVGTPTNMIFYREYQEHFSSFGVINFFSWFTIAGPLSFVFLLLAFWALKISFIKEKEKISLGKFYFLQEYKRLGPLGYEEKAISFVFVLTVLLWFTRSTIEVNGYTFYGWATLFAKADFITDSTVSIFMGIVLFLIPSKSEKGKFLMSWKEASNLPFDIVLLFGGGFAMAKGFEVSGLSQFMAGQLHFVSLMHPIIFITIMCVLITIISEFASNVACIQLMLPILIVIQKDMNIHPLTLLIPATLAASLGFILPVATAPNTIVFGSKRIHVADMRRVGIVLDIIGILLIVFITSLLL